jgi:hypothetical protein
MLAVSPTFRELGIDLPEMPPHARSSIDGYAPGDMYFSEWIVRQSVERQRRALGPERAGRLQAGYSFESLFFDDGRLIPLARLGERGIDHPPPVQRSRGIANLVMTITGLQSPDENGKRAANLSTVCSICGGVDIVITGTKSDDDFVRCAACDCLYGSVRAVRAHGIALAETAQRTGM